MALTLGPSLLRTAHPSRSRWLQRNAGQSSHTSAATETAQPPRTSVQVSEVHLHGVRHDVDAAALHMEVTRALTESMANQHTDRRPMPAGLQPNADATQLARHIAAEIRTRAKGEERTSVGLEKIL